MNDLERADALIEEVTDPETRNALKALAAHQREIQDLLDGKTVTTKITYTMPPGHVMTAGAIRAMNEGMRRGQA